MKAAELYENVTAAVVKSIEEGIADPSAWSPPWRKLGNYPTNASTGNAYRGGNVLWLAFVAEREGYATPHWATYKQWGPLHRQVRKGEKATYGIKWVFPTPEQVRKAKAAGADAPRAFPRTFTVFNFAQTDAVDDGAWEPPVVETRDPETIDADALAFFTRVGSTIKLGGNDAYYAPLLDEIHVPSPEQFRHAEGFASVLAHEHTHWTGAEKRCNRDLKGRFGNEAYAAEELVAELGAAFTCGRLGIEAEPRADHAHYLANWLTVLKNDSKALYKAASLAQAATDFIFEAAGVTAVETKVEVAA